jgi:DHA2 family multidrug resistance protein
MMAADVATLPMPRGRALALMGVVMLASFMQALDTTIANVAIPHMQGALAATPDTITWVLTSYIVASAVSTPVTGWLSDRFGRRSLFIVAIAGFTLASALCAAAQTLPMMVAARLLQGLLGAFIMPIGQSLVLDCNPPSKLPNVMMGFGMVVMVAPIGGPMLGGWLTDTLDWRWVFLINVPVGIATVAGIMIFLPKAQKLPTSRFDMTGFAFLFLAIGALQLLLDRGSQNDWFDSPEIIVEAAIAACGLWAFIIHTLSADAPLLPKAIFRNRNLVICSAFSLVVNGLVFASAALLPPMLQGLMGHDAFGAGMLTAPRGIGSILSMIVGTRLMARIDPRLLIFTGLVCCALALWMMMGFSLEMDSRPVMISGLIQGLGLGFVAIPLNLMAFATIDPHYRTQGASLLMLARSLGGSIVISMMSSLLVHQQKVSHADLAGHVTEQMIPLIGSHEVGSLTGMVLSMANGIVTQQAAMIGYLDAFTAMFWLVIAALPLVLIMKPPAKKARQDPDEAMHSMAME